MLVSAGILKGRKATSFFAIKDDLVAAGANYVDVEVAVDKNLITSRKPEDLPAFVVAIISGDGEFGTDDDLVLSRIDRVWENAFETFGEKMEELGTRIERINQNGQYGQYGFNGHNDIVSASTFGCTKSETKTKTRAEVYEQVAKAHVVQEPLAEAAVESDPASAAQPD